ncbi:MAG TPA: alpha-L-arabinofuranosidase C-terminal domain-containing protein [Verrucomicrobiae bacterium]|nr:alpha-L-arabinofuranosidase C-terminal domain-containing protein [Verrucomicrobiae bacterium]
MPATRLPGKQLFTRLAHLLAVMATPASLLNAQTNADLGTTNSADAQSNSLPVLQIKADQVTAKVSPMLYGLMTEEINFSYEGGLYGELVRNRTFKANPTSAVFWNALNGSISLDTNQPLNSALNVSLKLDTGKASQNTPAGIANGGYWGIPVRPNTTYRASFYARGAHCKGPLTVSLVHVVDSNNVTEKTPPGGQVFPGEMTETLAAATVPKISGKWQKYEVTLTTGNLAPSKDNRLVISTTKPGTFFNHHGTVWFQQVSLFPPTFNHRANGNRPDLMQMLADLHPKFLRFPGGNYLEGSTIAERFDWKKTIGDISQRPGHQSPWGYWSTDGFGLMEYLEWCEDLHMEPLLAVYAGYSLRQQHVAPGPGLQPYVQDALDEIEYVTGDTNTTWGAQRARDGHPAPFPLTYVEVGNEDEFDRSHSYDGRFAQFFDAIKAKYPDLQVIATARVTSRKPDLMDEHYYRSQPEMEAQSYQYDTRPRDGKTRVFVGEWATRVGSPTPNMAGALGDAAWMCGLERNSDLVVMASYAPLFVNVSKLTGPDRSMQWRTDLIGYDALRSYGSPSYYAQVMFSTHHGDEILATDSQNIPTRDWQPPARRRNGVEPPRPPVQPLPQIFFDATRDSASGMIYLKVVNELGTPEPVKIQISGATTVEPEGKAIVMKADSPDDTNSLQAPAKIVPTPETVNGFGADFTREFPPYSITILELKTK